MSNHDPSRSRPTARRLVLRKIAQPAGRLPTGEPPPDAGGSVRTPLPVPLAEIDALVLPKAAKTVTPAPAVEMADEPAVVSPAPKPPVKATYSSMPPAVVATVLTPLETVLDAPGKSRAASSWKGVIGGTVLGLAIVGAFVLGARLSQSPPVSPAAAAAGPAPPTATGLSTAAKVAAQPAPAPAPTKVDPSPPIIAATALPIAAPPVRWNPPVAPARTAPSPAANVPKSNVAVATQPATATSAPAAAPAASAAQTEPTPEDNAASLVPVIPASAPPVVDPLVKAVKDDIEEEQQARRK
jgi:hypothetical protein